MDTQTIDIGFAWICFAILGAIGKRHRLWWLVYFTGLYCLIEAFFYRQMESFVSRFF